MAFEKYTELGFANDSQEKQCIIKAMSDQSDNHQNHGVLKRTVLLCQAENDKHISEDFIAAEVPVAFAYNGNSHAVMMASPVNLTDFAIGFSITEGIIDTLDDILDIDIRQAKQGFTVQLQIADHLVERMEHRQRKFSGRSGCGICGITDLAAAVPSLEPLKKSAIPDHSVISQATIVLLKNQTMQQECGAVHCAGLFDSSGQLLAIREDVGRHNALDKLIGAQFGKIKLEHFVLMSSRASHELIVKTAIAGVGTLVSISAATSLAIDVADELNINLIGFIRGSRQIIYTKKA